MLRSQLLAGAGTLAVDLPINPLVTIGVAAPFSGSARTLGEGLANGVRAAVDDANRQRGSLDRIFGMRTFDDKNSSGEAMLGAQFATGDGNVIATIGHLGTRTTIQALPTYTAAQMPLIVPVATSDQITATNARNVFRLTTKDSVEGALFAAYVAAQIAPKAVHVFVPDGDYGSDVATGFIRALEARKIPTPYSQFPAEKPNFDAVIDAALTTPFGFAFLAGTVGEMGGIVARLRAKGYAGPIGASQGFFDPGTTRLGPAADGILVSTSAPYLPLAPTTVRIRTDFEARYGAMGPLPLFGYAAAQVVIGTIRRTGAGARNALLRAISTGVPIDTVAGSFQFDPNGDPLDPELYFYTVRDGKFAYLRQAHPSSFMLK